MTMRYSPAWPTGFKSTLRPTMMSPNVDASNCKHRLSIVILGQSITSSWGNGHATTFRGMMRALVMRGHDVLFLERDQPWYAANRDQPKPPLGHVELYHSLDELKERFAHEVRWADVVIVGSYVPEGREVGAWVTRIAEGVTAFYDIDTPVTLAQLEQNQCEYLSAELVSQYQLYLSFTGGPTLRMLEQKWHAQRARPLYCGVDPALHEPGNIETQWDLGYLGTYSVDRQPMLEQWLMEAARRWRSGRFVVAGPQYPKEINWPANVQRIMHVSPAEHRAFFGAQRFTLNLTRADMARAGYCPSVRLFEAAACGVPMLSDTWPGIEEFFEPGREIILVQSVEQVLSALREFDPHQARTMAHAARQRVLSSHTAAHRARELEKYAMEVLSH